VKVVLFCGGLGTRLREYSETIPKPMVNIGARPMIWNVMKYYAHYGHTDFILCLGYRGDMIRNYFLNYDECLSNDFVLSKGGKEVRLYNRDIADWTITFADTGQHSNIGQRLKAVEKYLDGEEVFLANYTDGLSDLPLDIYLDDFLRQRKTGSMLCVRPNHSFHLVQEPFRRMITAGQLMAYRHEGFWTCMDTLKDKQILDDMHARGERPWEVWKDAEKVEMTATLTPRRRDGSG